MTIGEFQAVSEEITGRAASGATGGKRPITETELKRAKDYVAGKMVLGLEDSESVAQYYASKQLLLGEIETPEQVMKRYDAVTLDQVQAAAKRLLLPGELRFAIIGPFKKAAVFEKILDDF